MGNIFIQKGIKILSVERGKRRVQLDVKKDYFGIIKLFRKDDDRPYNARSCSGCPVHCHSYMNMNDKASMRFIYYKRYNDILKDVFSEEYLGDVDRLFYLFKVFSIDFMGIIPVIRDIVNRAELMSDIGLPDKDKMNFMDIAVFLKNLNLDNNTFYNMLRNDFESFRNNYCPSLEKTGIHYFPVSVTKKERKLYSMDFYCSFLFDMRFDRVEELLRQKALYEFFGVCPNNIEVFDEYWLSKVGEIIDSKFSNISRMQQYADILLRYKYEVEEKYTGLNRYDGGKDEKVPE